MKREENYILEKMGQTNPFRVPDGYFDQLTSRIMEQLPDSDAMGQSVERATHIPLQKRSRFVALRPWLYAAASVVVVAVMSLAFYFQQSPTEAAPMAAASSVPSASDDSFIEDAADYVMLDNAEIYAYLADN